MGDRANVYIREDETRGVYLYTHWGGSELPEVVRVALASDVGRDRWDDPAYLARIIFCEMVRGNEREEGGFGISSTIGDNEYPVIVIDTRHRRLGFGVEPNGIESQSDPVAWIDFKSYCAQQSANWPKERD